MNEDYLVVLKYLKSECEREYKLFEIVKTVNFLNENYFAFSPILEDRFKLILRELFSEGFIDLKYVDEEVFIVKPLMKSFSIEEKEDDPPLSETGEKFYQKEIVFYLLVFAFSFLGAFLGGLLC